MMMLHPHAVVYFLSFHASKEKYDTVGVFFFQVREESTQSLHCWLVS